MTVVVYTVPHRLQCNATFRALDLLEIEYKVCDLSEDAAALELVESLGYLQPPVVMTPWGEWSGFRPDKIEELAGVLKQQGPIEDTKVPSGAAAFRTDAAS